MNGSRKHSQVRKNASIMHLDLDAFFAAVEQRDKPSLRGKPVIVGGTGLRGVVATASYEARKFGIHSAMSTAEARSRCPSAAFLRGRFHVYREASSVVMEYLRSISLLVEPLSLDEAFVDLSVSPKFVDTDVLEIIEEVQATIKNLTGGLTASIGVGSSKFIAKIASEINKPYGFYVVEPGTELEFLAPLDVKTIFGVGPVTNAKLAQFGIHTIEQLRQHTEKELASYVGAASGSALYRLARGIDHRPVVAERETKSVSVEDTFETDISDRGRLIATADAQARQVARRLAQQELSARTVIIKYRYHDFETHTRSATLAGPTDDPGVISRTALALLGKIDLASGLRLFGVGLHGLTDWVQEELFTEEVDPIIETIPAEPKFEWRTGMDVSHDRHGQGWVWGAGLNRVTIRFETAQTPPGPIFTFAADDPELSAL